MKSKVAFTLDSNIAKDAREIAESRGESLSAFVDHAIRRTYGVGMPSRQDELFEHLKDDPRERRKRALWDFLMRKLGE